ncbi:MAG: hypothetical protein ABFD50_20755 [Smithella sp.]
MADFIYITTSIVFFIVCLLFAGICNTVFRSNEYEHGLDKDLVKRID